MQPKSIADSVYPGRIAVAAEDDETLVIPLELYPPLIEPRFAPPAVSPRPAGFTRVPRPYGYQAGLLEATLAVNRAQRQLMIQKLQQKL